jgi:hypothetical protein
MTVLLSPRLVTYDEHAWWLDRLAKSAEGTGLHALRCLDWPTAYIGVWHPSLPDLVVVVSVQAPTYDTQVDSYFYAGPHPGAPCGAWLAPAGNVLLGAQCLARIVKPWVTLTQRSKQIDALARQGVLR